MTRCYLDTNFLYLHFDPIGRTDPGFGHWRAEVVEEKGEDHLVISALVIDELAYRLIIAWFRQDGERDPLSAYRADSAGAMRRMQGRLRRVWSAVDTIAPELSVADHSVVERAKMLMGRPARAPRDAFHAAHALESGCKVIVSSDMAFDAVRGLRRLGPR